MEHGESDDGEAPGGQSFRTLDAREAFWRPSNQMGVQNTDLAKQLDMSTLGARFWRLTPGQASTRHRHVNQTELYVLIEGTGRIRVDDTLLTLEPLSAVSVDPPAVRQIFNDTDQDVLWFVVGAPPELANTLEMTPERMALIYPDGPKALPPSSRRPNLTPFTRVIRDDSRPSVPARTYGGRVTSNSKPPRPPRKEQP